MSDEITKGKTPDEAEQKAAEPLPEQELEKVAGGGGDGNVYVFKSGGINHNQNVA
jgi:hypothetical protein